MAIDLLTRDQLRSLIKAYFSNLDPRLSLSIESLPGIVTEVLADAEIGHQYNAQAVIEAAFATLAEDEDLDRHAEAHFGPSARKPATTTDVTDDGIGILGTDGSVIGDGEVLVHLDGTRYQTVGVVTIGAQGVSGAATTGLQSLSTGTACNKLALEKLTFESPPPGAQAEATIVGGGRGLQGGTDAETDAELRVRILDVIRNPHAGGRFSDYRQWAMAVAKVLTAWVYGPHSGALTGRRGLGIVDLVALSPGTGLARLASAATVAAVQAAIDAVRPAAMAGFAVQTPTVTAVVFDTRVEPGIGYEWDWGGPSSAFTVDAYDPFDAAGVKLTWTTPLPSDVVAGVRVMVAGQIKTVLSVGTDYTILDSAFAAGTVSAGEDIWPAGPLSATVQAAIKAHLDVLGPAKGNAADPNQASWEDSVKRSKIYKEVLSVAGCIDCTVVLPAANVVPTDDVPAGVPELLIYGEITVRPL
jgi:uncharacterized phage protein gp47/JayE